MDKPERTAAPDIWDIRRRLNENFQRVEAILRALESQTDTDSRAQIEAAAELRHHIALAQKALETATSVEAARAFEQTVLDAIGEASPGTRRKIIARLNEKLAEPERTGPAGRHGP